MNALLKAASQVSSMWSLAAFAIVALILLVRRRQGKLTSPFLLVIAAIVIISSLPIAGSLYAGLATEKIKQSSSAIYRLRATVLNSQGMPVNEAKVTSSTGGEAKRVEGGWEFDIPSQARPADGRITIYAELANAFLKGKTDITLGEDHNPTVTVQLARDQSATIHGIVVDDSGRAVSGAKVSVIGYGGEAVTTEADGSFSLPAHAAENQQVQVHVETKRGAASPWVAAGGGANTIVVSR